jgi:hypothetical protein
VPGSVTVRWRRCATFAAVMPLDSSLTSLRCGSRPNSGQSSRRPEEAAEASGIAAAAIVGVETSAGAALPQAATQAQAAVARLRRVSVRNCIAAA